MYPQNSKVLLESLPRKIPGSNAGARPWSIQANSLAYSSCRGPGSFFFQVLVNSRIGYVFYNMCIQSRVAFSDFVLFTVFIDFVLFTILCFSLPLSILCFSRWKLVTNRQLQNWSMHRKFSIVLNVFSFPCVFSLWVVGCCYCCVWFTLLSHQNQLHVVRYLIRSGADIEARDQFLNTPLNDAVRSRYRVHHPFVS